MNTTGSNYLMIGEVARSHGVKGEIWIKINRNELFSNYDHKFVWIGNDFIKYSIIIARPHRKGVILKLIGCDNRDDADLLRGEEVYIESQHPDRLRPGEFFVQDLMGMKVVTIEGDRIGTLKDVLNTGANDVYVVKDSDDKEMLLPAIKSVIMNVDLIKKEMVVKLIPGL